MCQASYVKGLDPEHFRLPRKRPRSFVRDWPKQASDDMMNAMTFISRSDIPHDKQQAQAIFKEHGICIYRDLIENHPELREKYTKAREEIDNEYVLRNQNPKAKHLLDFSPSVFKTEPKKKGDVDAGDRRKKICMIKKDDENLAAASMAGYMYSAVNVLDEFQVVVQGQVTADSTNGRCKDPVMQACLLEDTAPAKGNRGEIQDDHVDAVIFLSPTGDKGAEGMQRCNAVCALEGNVNSWFFAIHDDYQLAFWPGMHELARACLQFFYENGSQLILDIKELHPQGDENELRRLIIDKIVCHLESTYSHLEPQSFSPVFCRFKAGDIIRLNSIMPHFGLPLHENAKNIRGFLLTSHKVIHIEFITNCRLLTSILSRKSLTIM